MYGNFGSGLTLFPLWFVGLRTICVRLYHGLRPVYSYRMRTNREEVENADHGRICCQYDAKTHAFNDL